MGKQEVDKIIRVLAGKRVSVNYGIVGAVLPSLVIFLYDGTRG